MCSILLICLSVVIFLFLYPLLNFLCDDELVFNKQLIVILFSTMRSKFNCYFVFNNDVQLFYDKL